MRRFTIVPDGPFSLELAAGFGFGHRQGAASKQMRLAFVTDDLQHQVGVVLSQAELNGPLDVEVTGEGDLEQIEAQVKRILSLDYSGSEWLKVGERDPVIADFQVQYEGLRPVLFHSPYEAATWSIISHRKFRGQAAKLRDNFSRQYGKVFELAGQEVTAFPLPQELLNVEGFPGLEQVRVERLHAVAEAALEGKLDVPAIKAMTSDEAMAAMKELPGIGPFYAGLIVIRGAGLADVLTDIEPRFVSFVQQLYGLDDKPNKAELDAIAAKWQPFRTWAMVLIRYAGGRANMPWKK